MGIVKQWLMDEAEKERAQEMREWFIAKHGRAPRRGEIDISEFEIDEAMEHAMSKDD
jgi:hypothetical protein